MAKYIALLRGINISGKNIIKMDALKQLFQKLKFENVQTYIQSGNVIFESNEVDLNLMNRGIENAIKSEFNLEVPVLLLDASYLATVAADNPFIHEQHIGIEELHLTFLKAAVTQEQLEKVKANYVGEDDVLLGHMALYVSCKNGYGQTKLHNNFFESKLKVSCTTRNWKTVLKLIEMSKQ